MSDHMRDAALLDEGYAGKRMPAHVAEAFDFCVRTAEQERRLEEVMTGTPMPTFTIKAQDALAIPTLRAYQLECVAHGLELQAEEVAKAIAEFAWWQETHINETKLPHHKHVPAARKEGT